MNKPANLVCGSTVGLVSPAGAVRNVAALHATVALLHDWGFNVRLAPHALTQEGYYSASTADRAGDILSFINDDEIAAILCTYGGYGCVHIADEFNTAIKKHPKWIIGMSDCCVLHAACLRAEVMSLHSPQCTQLSAQPGGAAAECLRSMLSGNAPRCTVEPHPLNIQGVAQGRLVGGNLSVLCSLLRTPYDVFKPGTILFIEDVSEPAHRIERMMHTLRLAGVLAELRGLLVGSFHHCPENIALGGDIYHLIYNIVSEYHIPVCFGFPVGHGAANIPLIEGAQAELTVTTSGVSLEYFA